MSTEQPGGAQPQHHQYQQPQQFQQQYQQYPGGPVQPGGPTPGQQPKQRGPIWLALIALIAGIACIFLTLVPGLTTLRYVLNAVGALLAIIGIVLAIVSLRKKWWKGLSIAGLAVSSFAVIFAAGFFALGFVANQMVTNQQNLAEAERQQKLQDEQAARDEILSSSQWLEDERAAMDPADYKEVTEAEFAEIYANPAEFQDQGIIVNGTMGLTYADPVLDPQGLCMVQVTLYATDGTPNINERSGVLDRGTADDCPLGDTMLGIGGGELGNVGESMSGDYRMWLVPGDKNTYDDGEELPLFFLMKLEN